MRLAKVTATVLAVVLAALVGGAVAQQTTEITFYYPIAVGGPITKIVDGYAEQFSKENPSIKVKPVYTGTYQESIVKALTAHKSGTPPVTSIVSPSVLTCSFSGEITSVISGIRSTVVCESTMSVFTAARSSAACPSAIPCATERRRSPIGTSASSDPICPIVGIRYSLKVTWGGDTSVLTVMKRGMIRAGGGTGFNVVRNRLEPSAEYEYVFDVR